MEVSCVLGLLSEVLGIGLLQFAGALYKEYGGHSRWIGGCLALISLASIAVPVQWFGNLGGHSPALP